MAGAAHLLNDNTGDLRSVQCERKSHVEFYGQNADLTLIFQYMSEVVNQGVEGNSTEP